jgi:hypothetical protein
MSQQCCTTESSAVLALRAEGLSRRIRRPSDSEIRVDKVLDIRRQLGEGTYSIADRLDVVVERILADLF